MNTLDILLRAIADTKGFDQTRAKLNEVKGAAQQAGGAAGELGSLIGLGLGVGAVAAVTAVASKFSDLGDKLIENARNLRDMTFKIGEQQTAWGSLALSAGKFFDVVRIGLRMVPELQAMTTQLRTLQATQLDFSSKAFDFFVRGPTAFGGPGPFEAQRQKAIKDMQDLVKNTLTQDVAILKLGEDSARAWQEMKAGPVADAIGQVASKLTELEAKRAAIDPSKSVDDLKRYLEKSQEIATWEGRRLELEKEQERLDKSGVRAGRAATERELTALMREQATVLQGIRQQQTLINASPFLGADERQAALLASFVSEMNLLQGIISQTKATMQNSAIDPAQYEQLNQKLQQSQFEFDLLRLKVVGLQKPFQTELIDWVNGFGTTAHQAANIVTGTLGTAIQGVSGAITGLIFQTGNWRQAMAQTVQSIVQNLIQVGLQMLIQQTLSRTIRAATVAESAASGPTIAAAYAPAAAATSIASFGSSAVIGEAAALAAILAIIGAVVAHEGGELKRSRIRRMHSGGLADDEIPIIAQEGEFMVRREVAQQVMPLLMALNAGQFFHSGGAIRRMHEGGWTEGAWKEPDWLPGNFLRGPLMSPHTGRGSPTGGGGPHVIIARDPGRGDRPSGSFRGRGGDYDETADTFFSGYGFLPSSGWAPFGPTMLPTFWVNYAGVGNVPMAVPLGGWFGMFGTTTPSGPDITPFHSGAPKPSEKHIGGLISRFPRFHSGGGVGGSGSAMRSAGAISIYAFTDLKEMSRHMASRSGQKIIFDTLRGRRIDLGLSR